MAMYSRTLVQTLACVAVLATYLLVIGAAPARDATPRPPGKLVDVGGWRLHVHRAGRGGPAVVIEAGSGDFSFDWALVTGPVSRFTTVVSYDRAGYAFSDPGPRPRTFRQLSWELHTALHAAGVEPPYVLVGHSYGGFLVRAFTRYYPAEVAGLVLAECMNEDSRVVINNEAARLREFAKGLPYPALTMHFAPTQTSNTRVTAQSEQKIEPPFDRLPASERKLHLWAVSRGPYEDAVHAELDWSPEELAEMYRDRPSNPHPLGDRPLIVLTRGEGGYEDVTNASAVELEAERLRLQADLATLSTNSRQIIDRNTGHNVHLEDPTAVVDAIHQVVDAVRKRSRLVR